jgi:3-phosphoshikimate 1-carboxyvinyltransferase
LARSASVHGTTRVTSSGPLRGSVSVPPSKSYTHRSVLMASLAEDGKSIIRNPLISRDTIATVEACASMGARVERKQGAVGITGTRPKIPDNVVNVENSGTTLRFMTSAFSLAPKGHVILTGDSSIRRRPMQPLLDTLAQLGVQAWSSRKNGCAPIIVEAGGMRGGDASIRGDVSSQFISSLLISTPLAEIDTTLEVADAVSRPYIEMTLTLLQRYGVRVRNNGYSLFDVESHQRYKPSDFTVPADFSSASFIVAAVAMLGGRVTIENLDASLPQGDAAIVEIARSMGAKVSDEDGALVVTSDGDPLTGGKFDLRDTPDLLPVVAALALKADSPVEIEGTAHARFKETDRIAIVAEELSKLGVNIKEREDGLRILPTKGRLAAAPLDAHDDHRMFMAFSLASMLIPGGTPVKGAESLDVSYPSFLEDIKSLGAKVKSD